MGSNLQIQSNLMITDVIKGETLYRNFFPGDYFGVLLPEYADERNIDRYMTLKQKAEYHQYKVCRLCRRACAGTCTTNKT
ncbi:hypothetical protein QFZ78_003814 [Paenibacillus sp. V4I5]|nr:hypothetical protein [Paenibacillus sp. V4I5]